MAGSNGKSIRFYEGDSGEIHAVRVDDKTLTFEAVRGTPQVLPTGPVTSPFWAKISRAKTEYGLKTRMVGICFETTAPAGLEVGPTYDVAVLSKGQFDLLSLRSEVAYQGENAIVVGKTDENIYPGI